MTRYLIALSLSMVALGELPAQDSSRADWRAWAAAKDSAAACQRLPMIFRARGLKGEYTVHRDSTGHTCRAGPGPWDPSAWVIDSVVFCPDSSPATWGTNPPNGPEIGPQTLVEIHASTDSAAIAALGCSLTPRMIWYVRLRHSP